MSDPRDLDERYEDSLRNRHTADTVSRGTAGHGPCDVCFLLARLGRARRTVEEAKMGERAEIRLREQHQRERDQARQDVWDVRIGWYGAVIERDQARQDVLMMRDVVLDWHECEPLDEDGGLECSGCKALVQTAHYEQHRAREGEA